MKKILNCLLLAGVCALAGRVGAAALTIDLRAATKPSSGTRLLAAPAGSCLQTGTLAAGATATDALSVGDVLTFLLFKDIEIRITLVERMESPLGGEAFIGTVSGYDGVRNAVVLQTAEGLTADIQDFARSRAYTIVSDATGVTVKEIDPALDAVTPTEPADPGLPAGQSSARLLSATLMADQPTTLVDVLVAYDTPAAAWARQNGGGITNFATMAVQKMNTVLGNCGFASTFRYRLVGVMTVDATGGTDFDGVLAATRDGTGNWAPIKVMRNTVGADIVTTLIDTGLSSGTTGFSYSLSGTTLSSFSESAYNVCAVRAVANGHTMTHEVGHNIGAGHATSVNPSEISPGPQLYNYSAGYYFTGTDGVAYHTIMAYSYDGYGNHYTSAPFFSSPNLTYMGTTVGDATHDNVRTIQQTYLAASNWRTQVLPMSYDVFFSPGHGATFTDSITVTLTPGKAGLPIRYTLDGSTPTASSTLYTGPLTLTQTTTIRAITVMDGVAGPMFEATYSLSDLGNGLDAPQLVWTTSPDYPWTFQTDTTYDGVDAVRSVFFNSENESGPTWLKTTVTGPTTMSFRYKKKFYSSSFTVTCDSSELYSDTTTGTSSDWSLVEMIVPSGNHEIKFEFCQGGYYYDSSGYTFNGIWLDTIRFDALSRPPTISPATTMYESTAYTFQGSQTIAITPPTDKQGVLYYTTDGSDPAGETAHAYNGPITITESTCIRTVFVESGKEPSVEVGGLFLERHPVSPGEWTTDAEGARTAAAQNGRLIAVLLANRAECWWSQQFYSIAESPGFLAWAKANGIYLVTADTSCHIDAEAAQSWFWTLCQSYTGSYRANYPQIYFANPSDPYTAIDQGLARKNSLVGSVTYLDTAESLIAGFASVLGDSVLQAPTCSRTESLVDGFPIKVTLSNPNGRGTIYYTLDGSVPDPSNGIAYSGTITIPNSATTLTAIVWPSTGLPSGAYVGNFKAINDVFGTSGISWSRSGTGSWREGDEAGTLRTGGLRSKTYTATLKATVTGKGKFVFKYAVNSMSSRNSFAFKVNNSQRFSCAYSNGTQSFSGSITNVVSSDTTTTYTWTYTVNDASRDYGSGYVTQAGAWLGNVEWIPAKPDPVEKVPYIGGIADPADGGKVTGGGPCASGKTVTLKAVANKHFTFMGWRANGVTVATTPTLVIDRTANPAKSSNTSTTVTGVTQDTTYCAVFKSDPEVFIAVDTTPQGAALTGKGVGKYVAGTVTGMGKYAPGKTKIALKATANKYYVFAGWYASSDDDEPLTRSATYTIARMGETDVRYTAKFITAKEDREHIGLEVNGTTMPSESTAKRSWTNFCGVAVNWPVISSGLSETTVKVTGLPSGLKLVQDKVTKAYTIAGAPSAASKVDKKGVVTPSKVVFTVTTSGKSSQRFAIDLYVTPLPAWAVGTFKGAARRVAGGAIGGSVTLAVAANGKISGKAVINGTAWTFKANAISAVERPVPDATATSGTVTTNFIINATAAAGKATLPLNLSLAAFAYDDLPSSATSRAVGTLGNNDATLYRVIWPDKADTAAAKLIARYASAYSFTTAYGKGTGTVAFTLDEKGGVKGAATLPDGAKTRSASFSENALVEEDGLHVVVALAPDARRGYAALYADRLLVPHSGKATDGLAFRRPCVVAETAPYFEESGSTASGTVAVTPKYGQVAPGKTVTLKATAAKNCVFAGWYDGTTLLSQAANYALPAPTDDMTVTAKFVTMSEDKTQITLSVNGVKLSGAPSISRTWTNWCGVAVNWPVVSGGLSATTVKASGLPSGLKLVQDKITKTYSVSGAPTAASKADARTGRVMPSKVVFTVTTAGKSTQTFAINLYINPLPAWAVGTFDGVTAARSGIIQAMTIAPTGKISGKLLENGTTWTFSAASFNAALNRAEGSPVQGNAVEFTAMVNGKLGKEVITNTIAVTATAIDGEAVGIVKSPGVTDEIPADPLAWTAWQNQWKRTDTKGKMPVFTKNIDKTLELGEADDVNNSVKLTFKKDGMVAFAGMIGGRKVSGSSQLVRTETDWQVTIYAPPHKPETLSVTLKSQNIASESEVNVERLD